ncbi:MAG: hypothetical protein M1829_004327 [Trizodia sp. TS-e1964]|nr:MAG: hypothetical protein M1829_004327 [Trizodia sp. TS-e1964]
MASNGIFTKGAPAHLLDRKCGREQRCQGVQKVGMLTPWLTAFPNTITPLIEEMDSLLGFNLSALIANGPSAELTATENAQPAIMATSLMILRVLQQDFNFDVAKRIDITLGHSMGEFAALVAGGYLSYPDALALVRRRGVVMASLSRHARAEGVEWGMVALVCEEDDALPSLIAAIHDFLGHGSAGAKQDSSQVPAIAQVSIANINSKNQIVLSGSIERIHTLLTHIRQFGGHTPRAVRLAADSPFHSPLMRPAVKEMREMLSRPGHEGGDMVTFPGRFPCVSNVSARPFESLVELKELLARQCVDTIRWWDSVRYVDKREKVRRWVGIGPGLVGRNLVGKEVGLRGSDVKGGGVWGVNEPREVEEIMRALDDTEEVSLGELEG